MSLRIALLPTNEEQYRMSKKDKWMVGFFHYLLQGFAQQTAELRPFLIWKIREYLSTVALTTKIALSQSSY